MRDTSSIYTTTKVYMLGNTPAIYLEKWWGLEKGAMVDVKFYKFKDNSPTNKVVDLGKKKVCAIGAGIGIYIGVNRGVGKGDAIVAKITGATDGDARDKAEEGLESPLE